MFSHIKINYIKNIWVVFASFSKQYDLSWIYEEAFFCCSRTPSLCNIIFGSAWNERVRNVGRREELWMNGGIIYWVVIFIIITSFLLTSTHLACVSTKLCSLNLANWCWKKRLCILLACVCHKNLQSSIISFNFKRTAAITLL